MSLEDVLIGHLQAADFTRHPFAPRMRAPHVTVMGGMRGKGFSTKFTLRSHESREFINCECSAVIRQQSVI